MSHFKHLDFKAAIKRKLNQMLPLAFGKKIAFASALKTQQKLTSELKSTSTKSTPKILKQSSHRFIFFAETREIQGLDVVIEAFAQIKNLLGLASLDVYWSNSYTYIKECKQLVFKHHLESCVSFKKSPNKEHLYKQYDILLMPLRMREGFNSLALDALKHGLGVITINTFDSAEKIAATQNGWSLLEHTPQALADKILFALKNPEALARIRQNTWQDPHHSFPTKQGVQNFEHILVQPTNQP
jgi:glycosyltransferase involved in cell wall biosynthesis